jgi:superfamily II DNA or RNA helicase
VIELRPYQIDVVDKVEQALGTAARPLLVAPTGSGKTVIAAEIIRRAAAKYRTALFLAHRREIITQTSAKLTANGVRHGIIMAGMKPRPMELVQVASIDTLHVRGVRSKAMELPPADLLIFDEAHRARGRTREQLIALYPNAALLGMTATPCRGDGRGLGNIFDTMIECPQVADLIVGGFLVKSRVYAPVDPDLRGVRVEQGDYVVGQLERRMNTDALVGDIVEQRSPADCVLRCRCRALGPYPQRVRTSRRPRRAPGRKHVDRRARGDPCAVGVRRDRDRHQLHGADRGLGHARGRLLHPGAAHQADGRLPPDGRPGAASG